MISVEEARKIVAETVRIPQPEPVPLRDLAGRVLAAPVEAPYPQPRFTNSAMDGFAVRSADLADARKTHAVTLSLTGVAKAGPGAPGNVGPGKCRQVMTGAALPAGADAVVKVEDTSGFESSPVGFYHSPEQGEHIRPAGGEIKAGGRLMSAGTRLGPAELGVLAGCGLTEAQVYPQPRVAIITTGDELIAPDQELQPGTIYNSNRPLLGALTDLAGAKLVHQESVPDDPTTLRVNFTAALQQASVVVTCGGVSMGRFDHVRDVLATMGVKQLFWQVAQKPGKPLYFGVGLDSLVFGLPGNPVSALIAFMEFVWPTLEALQGLAQPPRPRANLAAPFPRIPDRSRFLLGEAWVEDRRVMARPTRKRGS
ncbi:MAG: gephyrin-like molybdotransferase Glp, partial [Candidatus Neomarinimicrobiota bacterium]